MKTTRLDEQLKITVKRPNGEIETVFKTENVRYVGNTLKVQALCVKATKDAGKGDIQSFEIVDVVVDLTPEQIRQELVNDVCAAQYAYDAALESDYENDIGMLLSPDHEKEIDAAQHALNKFDIENPLMTAARNKAKAKQTERQIQSALNA